MISLNPQSGELTSHCSDCTGVKVVIGKGVWKTGGAGKILLKLVTPWKTRDMGFRSNKGAGFWRDIQLYFYTLATETIQWNLCESSDVGQTAFKRRDPINQVVLRHTLLRSIPCYQIECPVSQKRQRVSSLRFVVVTASSGFASSMAPLSFSFSVLVSRRTFYCKNPSKSIRRTHLSCYFFQTCREAQVCIWS